MKVGGGGGDSWLSGAEQNGMVMERILSAIGVRKSKDSLVKTIYPQNPSRLEPKIAREIAAIF